jgi:membrane-bound lytic murein transglycosylase D
MIQASVILGKNPEKYGLPTELAPPLNYAEVSVSKPIDLRAVARVLSTSLDELKRLNPSLRGLTTPANYPNFQLKVPIDSDPDLHKQLTSLPAAKVRLPAEFGSRYKVKRGDTLSKIAARHRVSVRELQQANGLSSKSKIRAGMWLQVPSQSAETTKTAASKSTANTKKTASTKNKRKVTTSSVKALTNARKSG